MLGLVRCSVKTLTHGWCWGKDAAAEGWLWYSFLTLSSW